MYSQYQVRRGCIKPLIQQIICHGQRMPRICRNLELPFLPTMQVEFPAYPLDPMNPHDNSVIGQISLQALRATATAMDYNVDAEITQTFFTTVQNKLHFAIHGRTAAELIVERADSTKDRMGLTTWKKAPHGKIITPDVSR